MKVLKFRLLYSTFLPLPSRLAHIIINLGTTEAELVILDFTIFHLETTAVQSLQYIGHFGRLKQKLVGVLQDLEINSDKRAVEACQSTTLTINAAEHTEQHTVLYTSLHFRNKHSQAAKVRANIAENSCFFLEAYAHRLRSWIQGLRTDVQSSPHGLLQLFHGFLDALHTFLSADLSKLNSALVFKLDIQCNFLKVGLMAHHCCSRNAGAIIHPNTADCAVCAEIGGASVSMQMGAEVCGYIFYCTIVPFLKRSRLILGPPEAVLTGPCQIGVSEESLQAVGC